MHELLRHLQTFPFDEVSFVILKVALFLMFLAAVVRLITNEFKKK